jgi:hypothetical protein
LEGEALRLRELEVATAEERALVKPLLERLCDEQYVFEGQKLASLCDKLVRLNILRPTGETRMSANYEFHSFLTEVCVRALLGKPAIERDPTFTFKALVESKGRGSEKDIAFLISARPASFEKQQKEVLQLLKDSGDGNEPNP